jgi:hypothetical protein
VLLHALKGLLVVLRSLYFEKTPTEALIMEVRCPAPLAARHRVTTAAALR